MGSAGERVTAALNKDREESSASPRPHTWGAPFSGPRADLAERDVLLDVLLVRLSPHEWCGQLDLWTHPGQASVFQTAWMVSSWDA